mmetsp:Transcript_8763/g.15060  ORF Transcript_8763/g.15060 Transcript_8763/m.15060 type:complete len:96 (+) Transcript_8763:458-745(+)
MERGGVVESLSPSLVAIVIENGAHHLDLMWSHPLDPPSVLEARLTEKRHMHKWVAEANARTETQPKSGPKRTDAAPDVLFEENIHRAGSALLSDF